jgi:hypothetical protein
MANTFRDRPISPSTIAGMMNDINALQASVGFHAVQACPRRRIAASQDVVGPRQMTAYDNLLYIRSIWTSQTNWMLIYDEDLRFVSSWQATAMDSSSPANGGGICVDSSGNLYLTGYISNIPYLYKYTRAGVLLGSWVLGVSGDFVGTITTDNVHLYISGFVSGVGSSVWKYTMAGLYVTEWTVQSMGWNSLGGGNGLGGKHITYNANNASLYAVVEDPVDGASVGYFTTDGVALGSWEIGTWNDALAVKNGEIYVVQSANIPQADSLLSSGVRRFSSAGILLDTYGHSFFGDVTTRGHCGSFELGSACFSDNGDLYIGSNFEPILQRIGSSTPWFRYEMEANELLAVPVSSSSLAESHLSSMLIFDLRSAVEGLCHRFESSSPGYHWQFGNADVTSIVWAAMGDRTEYGATIGAKYTWTRRDSWRTANAVIGQDSNKYISLRGHLSTLANRPPDGVDAGLFWVPLGAWPFSVPAWREDAVYYGPNDFSPTAVSRNIVMGTDGYHYWCKDDCVGADSNRPVTGENWQQHWHLRNIGLTPTNFLNGRQYYSPRVYDIDWGEIAACISVLQASTPL